MLSWWRQRHERRMPCQAPVCGELNSFVDCLHSQTPLQLRCLAAMWVVHAHSRKLTAYRGNYDTFEKTAAERMRNQRKAAESVALKKQHMQVCTGNSSDLRLLCVLCSSAKSNQHLRRVHMSSSHLDVGATAMIHWVVPCCEPLP